MEEAEVPDAPRQGGVPSGPGDSSATLERRTGILSFVRARDFVRIQELSRQFGVSDVTIRSDLDILARAGGLRRVRGGVMRLNTNVPQQRYEARTDSNPGEKAAIGAAVAAMLANGDSVILDAGTTAMAVANAIAERTELSDLTVFTAGLNVALALERAVPRIDVVVTGGTLRPQQHALVGPMSAMTLSTIRATYAFIGCNGLDPGMGVMALSLPDAALKQSIAAAAHRVAVIADSSKFSQTSLVRACTFDEIDQIITAGEPDATTLALIREQGIDVVIAPSA